MFVQTTKSKIVFKTNLQDIYDFRHSSLVWKVPACKGEFVSSKVILNLSKIIILKLQFELEAKEGFLFRVETAKAVKD